MTDTYLQNPRRRFPILDLVASLDYLTLCSASFKLGTEEDSLLMPDGRKFDCAGGVVFKDTGWVDVHYPCDGHIKVLLRVALPRSYHVYSQMSEFVRQMLSALNIPADETYEALFMSDETRESIVQSVDRFGMTDRT